MHSTPSVESQVTQHKQSEAPAEQQAIAQPILPTPVATQDATLQNIARLDQATEAPSTTTVEDSTGATTLEPTPAPTNTEIPRQQPQNDIETPRLSSPRTKSPRPADNDLESGRSSKRRRIERTTETQQAQQSSGYTITEPTPAVQGVPVFQQIEEPDISAPIEPTAEQLTDTAPQVAGIAPMSTARVQTEATSGVNEEASASQIPANDTQTITQVQPRRSRRVLPWVAVNQPRDEDENTGTPHATARPTKARGKRTATTTVHTENEEQGERGEDEATSGPNLRRGRGRGKRRAAVDTEEGNMGDERTIPSTKKVRKTRKDKGTRRKKSDAMDEDGEGEAAGTEKTRPRRRRPAKKQGTKTGEVAEEEEREGDGEVEQNQPRHRKRHQREATPSDAENEKIDTAATFMDNLASRNIRTGKLSDREKKMREINWAEVKQRRREEEAVGVATKGNQAEVDEALNRAGEARAEAENQQQSGPQFQEIDGQIMLVQGNNVIDREADADREIELMEQVEEDDLTMRITSRSFMRDNKRFPQEFLLPGQGKRWSQEGTERFYDALQMFGTDFMMISTLFPGTTRRSIKTKFNREERENPSRIKAALNAQRNSDWNDYLHQTGIPDDAFADPRAIERELEEERERFQVEIEAAKLAAEEEKRQRKLAGMDEPEEENQEGSAKENSRKKGRKKKDRQLGKAATIEPEEGLEIIGDIEDDD